ELAVFDSTEVKCAVAARQDIPPEILRQLAEDPRGSAVHIVAANPKAPPEVLSGLLTTTSESMRCALAENPSTPVAALAQLRGDAALPVRTAALRSLSLRGDKGSEPAEALALLRRAGAAPDLSRVAAPDLSLTPEQLARLGQGRGFARALAAAHPN